MPIASREGLMALDQQCVLADEERLGYVVPNGSLEWE